MIFTGNVFSGRLDNEHVIKTMSDAKHPAFQGEDFVKAINTHYPSSFAQLIDDQSADESSDCSHNDITYYDKMNEVEQRVRRAVARGEEMLCIDYVC